MDMELKELSSLRSDSFKNQILDELNTKYFSIRMEIEKREEKLMNKVEKWEEMLEQQRVRISDLFNKNYETKDLVGVIEEKMRKESLSECAHVLKQTEVYKTMIMQLQAEIESTFQFKDFMNCRLDALDNSLKWQGKRIFEH